MKKATSGFTIVELLIVIVVIAILAAISIVAYNGIQQRARDAERRQELGVIQKALEMYQADNGGYPRCNVTAVNSPPAYSATDAVSCLTGELVPTYLNEIPVDPVNSGNQRYLYGAGYRKTSVNAYDIPPTPATNNYILGVRLETVASPTYSGWGETGLTLLLGSSN